MTKTLTPALALLLATGLAAFAGCDDKKGAASSGAPESSSATPTVAAVAASATPAAAPSAAPDTSAVAVAPSAVASAAAAPSQSAAAAPADSAAAGAKVYDCGAKGQKPCPMQGWMKSVMANAVASNDADKLAAALTTIAGKAPPGMGSWTQIASAGAAKAKAGDIDAAKVSCKQCHDAFKETYKKTMRDRPF